MFALQQPYKIALMSSSYSTVLKVSLYQIKFFFNKLFFLFYNLLLLLKKLEKKIEVIL